MRMKIGNLLSGHHCYYCYYHYIVFGGSVARVEVVVQDRLVALPYRSTVHGMVVHYYQLPPPLDPCLFHQR